MENLFVVIFRGIWRLIAGIVMWIVIHLVTTLVLGVAAYFAITSGWEVGVTSLCLSIVLIVAFRFVFARGFRRVRSVQKTIRTKVLARSRMKRLFKDLRLDEQDGSAFKHSPKVGRVRRTDA